MYFQIALNDVWLSLWTKIFLEEQHPAGHIFPLLFLFFCFLFSSPVLESSVRWWQNCPATPSPLLSPLIFFIVYGSRTLQPPTSFPSQSIIPRTINRSQPPNPSLWLATTLLLTGWVWPLTPWADSSISFLWHQSQLRKRERNHTWLWGKKTRHWQGSFEFLFSLQPFIASVFGFNLWSATANHFGHLHHPHILLVSFISSNRNQCF